MSHFKNNCVQTSIPYSIPNFSSAIEKSPTYDNLYIIQRNHVYGMDKGASLCKCGINMYENSTHMLRLSM